MRIEIDTIQKTIIVKDQVAINDLINELQKMNINLSEYHLKSEYVSAPYVYYPYQSPYNPPRPFNELITYCAESGNAGSVTSSQNAPYTYTHQIIN